ncbi:unnamed protein product [Mytilus coruscus]|uniref:DUF3504 domain-containing protein n=1 Tax=Mytilus coruscus TaxID=42192 RepID=A0A6J8EPF5_MYTCO|nr:unnamed protein product [Mytilus coruscus]
MFKYNHFVHLQVYELIGEYKFRDEDFALNYTMKCAKESCGAEIADGAKFCIICGTKVVVTTTVKKALCPECNHFVLESHNFCLNCGWKVNLAIFTDKICKGVKENGEQCSVILTFDAKFCPSCGTPTKTSDVSSEPVKPEQGTTEDLDKDTNLNPVVSIQKSETTFLTETKDVKENENLIEPERIGLHVESDRNSDESEPGSPEIWTPPSLFKESSESSDRVETSTEKVEIKDKTNGNQVQVSQENILTDLNQQKEDSQERTTKTRTGAKSGDVRDVTPKMFAQPNSDYYPVKLFKLYVSKRPEDLRSDPESRFYLRPLPNPDKDGVWYCRQPLGKNKLGMMMKTMAVTAELYGRKVNHSTRKTFATTLLQSERPVTEVAQLGGWKSISTLTHYNIPSIKQQSKASKILSEITIPESSNELDAVNLMNEPEHSFDTVIVNEPEHSFDTEPNDNNPDNLNNELETVLEKENIPNPIFSQSSSMNSKMISTATRKESNPFSILCGATITGGVINLNIYSGKRKHYELDSSQE